LTKNTKANPAAQSLLLWARLKINFIKYNQIKSSTLKLCIVAFTLQNHSNIKPPKSQETLYRFHKPNYKNYVKSGDFCAAMYIAHKTIAIRYCRHSFSSFLELRPFR
jgi:hypothetical protein